MRVMAVPPARTELKKRIGYLLLDFPIPNMPYVLNEITDLFDMGISLEVLSLDKPRHRNVHQDYYRYGLDQKTLYFPHKRDLHGKDIGTLRTLVRGFIALVTNHCIDLSQRWTLLRYCHDSSLGKILSLRRFLACLDIAGAIKKKKLK